MFILIIVLTAAVSTTQINEKEMDLNFSSNKNMMATGRLDEAKRDRRNHQINFLTVFIWH